jgi:hypothetical protein
MEVGGNLGGRVARGWEMLFEMRRVLNAYAFMSLKYQDDHCCSIIKMHVIDIMVIRRSTYARENYIARKDSNCSSWIVCI